MRGTYIMLILLLFCIFGVVTAQGEINEEQDIVKSAETAKESMNEVLSSIIYAFDATMKVYSAIYDMFVNTWDTVTSALNSTGSPPKEDKTEDPPEESNTEGRGQMRWDGKQWVYETEDGILMQWNGKQWVYETEDGIQVRWNGKQWVYETEDGRMLLATDKGWEYETEDGLVMLATEEGWVSGTGDGMVLWSEKDGKWIPLND